MYVVSGRESYHIYARTATRKKAEKALIRVAKEEYCVPSAFEILGPVTCPSCGAGGHAGNSRKLKSAQKK